MKKKEKSKRKEYLLPIQIYFEDLKKIEETLNEHTKQLTITTDEYEFENLDELYEKFKGTKLESLNIRSSSPHTKVEFDKFSASIYIGSSDTISCGIYHKIDKILSNRKHGISWIYNFNVLIWFSMLCFSILFLELRYNIDLTKNPLYS